MGPAGVRRRAEDRAADPPGGPDAAFLERFLAAREAGPHHFNFLVSDIGATLARIRALGIEPVGVNLDHPNWQEAFLHPRNAYGIVVQVAQQAGSPPAGTPPAELPEPGPPTSFGLIEHHVGDLAGATRLFTEALDGRLEAASDDTAELTWPGGKQIRLVREDGLPLGGLLHHIRFTRAEGTFSAQDRERTGLLAKRLGVAVELAGERPRSAEADGNRTRQRCTQRSPVLKTGGPTRYPDASASTLLRRSRAYGVRRRRSPAQHTAAGLGPTAVR